MMGRVTTKSVVTLMEDKLLRFNVATVNHVAHTVSEEVTTCLLLTVLLNMDSPVASTVKTPLPLPAGCVKRAIVLLDFNHERISPVLVSDKGFYVRSLRHKTHCS
jgi:hypothetical protein